MAKSSPMKNFPEIIPPLSRVRLARPKLSTPGWIGREGEEFRIGYYGRQDGLDVIWLVNSEGIYLDTTDKSTLLRCFDIEFLSL